MIVTNGGRLNVYRDLRVGTAGGTGNVFVVSDPNTRVEVTLPRLGAGALGDGNVMIVSNGATFMSGGGSLGSGGGCYCTAIVVGANSKWISTNYPGASSGRIVTSCNSSPGMSNNCLRVYDGGSIYLVGTPDAYIEIGTATGTKNDAFLMGGTGLMSTGIVINSGLCRFSANTGFARMEFTNSFFQVPTFNIGGTNNIATIHPSGTVLIAGEFSTNDSINTINIGGADSAMVVNGGLLNNQSGSNRFGLVVNNFASLVVSNSGKLLTEVGTIGNGSPATVVVTGVGSVWSNTGPYQVAGLRTNVLNFATNSGGSTNSNLTVRDGGSLYDNGDFIVAGSATASNNTVNLGGSGAASTVTIRGLLHVGAARGSSSNQVTVTNATVNCENITVGNEMVVTPLFTFTTNNIDLGLVVTNFCGSTNGLVATVLTNCVTIVDTNPVFNTLTVNSGTITGGLVRVYGTNSIVYNGGAIQFATLQVDGNMTGAAALNVPSGSTLKGVGSIANPVTIDGTLAPGTSPGTLTISNNLVLNSGATLTYELGTSSDRTVVTGNLTLDGTLNVSDSGGFGVGNYTLDHLCGRVGQQRAGGRHDAEPGLELRSCRRRRHGSPSSDRWRA